MKKIIRAEHSGFCFGVKAAVESAETALAEKKEDEHIYSCGPLIHNSGVTNDLKRRGLDIIASPEDAEKGASIIIRSHGVGEEFYSIAEKRGLRIIDATCPFVKTIHTLVNEAYKDGKAIVVIGDSEHPEVKGINGWCDNSAIIVNDRESASTIEDENIFVVAQTTIRQDLFEDVCASLKAKEKVITNTICNTTRQRQDSCMKTASSVDLMLIIGGKGSSNTRKLYDISKKFCNKTYFVENIRDLPLKEVEKCNKIGIAAGASTPECAIKEVIANMTENNTANEKVSMSDFMEEIEQSLRLPRSGELVTGKICHVYDNEVIVNLGCKKDGVLPLGEVSLDEGQTLFDLFKEGDEVQAKVVKTDDGEGVITLSRKRLEINEHWKELSEALENKELVHVKVIRTVRGGVIAAYKEVTGFIPLSQLSDKFIENPEEFIGAEFDVYVTRIDQARNRVSFSRREVLNEEKQKALAEIWAQLSEGDLIEGTVMRFTNYGAFVDIGGIDGLLHISEISWGKLKHPGEVLAIGEKVQVKILSMNEEKGKISLGLKQTIPEPWTIIDDKYEVGQVVRGKVVQIKEYGAFVELEPGLDGLVHISEIAHKRVENIGEEFSVGDEVDAKILDIDKESKRISLSIKACVEPTEDAEEAAAEDVVEEVATDEPVVDEAPAVEEATEEAPVAEETPVEDAPAEEEAPSEE